MRRLVVAFLSAVIGLGIWSGVASADQTYPAPQPDPTVTTAPQELVRDVPVTDVSELPFTGGDAFGLALIGLGITGAGAAMVLVRRSRSAEQTS